MSKYGNLTLQHQELNEQEQMGRYNKQQQDMYHNEYQGSKFTED